MQSLGAFDNRQIEPGRAHGHLQLALKRGYLGWGKAGPGFAGLLLSKEGKRLCNVAMKSLPLAAFDCTASCIRPLNI